jgi:hypothetical protein
MNPLYAGLLLLFAAGITLVPWRRAQAGAPGRALIIEGALLLAVVSLGHLVADLAEPTPTGLRWGRWIVYGAAYWYVVAGGVGIVQLVLAHVPVRERTGTDGEGIGVPQGELARGRIIGILERALALTLVLLGQYGALGLVVAAKAIARFRGLEDRDFAEYFLIGTLASLLHAVIVGVGLQLLL